MAKLMSRWLRMVLTIAVELAVMVGTSQVIDLFGWNGALEDIASGMSGGAGLLAGYWLRDYLPRPQHTDEGADVDAPESSMDERNR